MGEKNKGIGNFIIGIKRKIAGIRFSHKSSGLDFVIFSDLTLGCLGPSFNLGHSSRHHYYIPEKVFGMRVVKICNLAFKGNHCILGITLPHTVEYIGDKAFCDCINLNSIFIPDSVEYIGHFAFNNCSSLVNVYIPKSVHYMDINTFSNCSSLEVINIPEGIDVIPAGFCEGCISLKTIDMPPTIHEIGIYAFAKCKNLRSINLSISLKNIHDYAFCGCISLTEVIIPDSVKLIGEYAFYNCDKLAFLSLGKVSEIKESAFNSCGLSIITIPDTISFIGKEAFLIYTELKEIRAKDFTKYEWRERNKLIKLPSAPSVVFKDTILRNPVVEGGVTYWISTLYPIVSVLDCDKNNENIEILSYIDGDPVTEISSGAFEGCKKLTNIFPPYNKLIKYIKIYNIGDINIILSNLSSIPPCPGINLE